MGLQVRFRNEPASLPVYGVQRARGERGVQWNGQRLSFARGQRSSELAVTAPCGDDLESNPHESRSDVAAGQLFKPQ